jgi:proline racemase
VSTAGLSVGTIDYHTGGEPFRIVTEGVPPLKGRTILEKRRFAAERLDHIRRLLVFEPRGHADMYGCFVTEPEDEGADLGVVFFHNDGYSTACGHGTIALVTWAIESGRVAGPEVIVDVPSGRLPTVARIEDGQVVSVRFRNVPAFVHGRGLEAAGRQVDVAFGGAFYASLEERVDPKELPRLIELGRAIKADLEREHEIVHPREPELRGVYGVIFWQEEGAKPFAQRNVTVFADGEVDRSPCGSGTSARLALLHDEGRIGLGEALLHRSIVGSEFTGRVIEETAEGVVTEVEGSAHLTGRHEFVLEPGDELGEGFLLR